MEVKQPSQALRLRPPLARKDPWLVQVHGKKDENQTFFNVSEGRYHVKSIPQMRGKEICTSSFGWLVLGDDQSHDCFLLNPVSMQKIQLPSYSLDYNFCLLTSPPEQPNCLVLFITCETIRRSGVFISVNMSFRFCHPGDHNWVELKREPVEDRGQLIISATCFDGRIYLLNSSGNFVLVEVKPDLRFTHQGIGRLPPRKRGTCRWTFTKLIDVGGDLFLIQQICHLLNLQEDVQIDDFIIYRLNVDLKVWEMVENIGDLAFFLSPTSKAWCWGSKSGIKGNTIYFIQHNDLSLYAFDLEEKSIAVSLPCPNLKRSPWRLSADWVMPLI
ncbi:hypothetical protein SLEP1_g20552 [Rubroshorea leprosula]|uniref:KIB1-4 beta-propeller domain-containing protein n=1 Tax=Rubroshorea leprosula TaxID=152421 RepID=A0AAV5J960_9ROSI|nr:hypothetical protein SLEP1_g20552 [Rubroshorea leprosula]